MIDDDDDLITFQNISLSIDKHNSPRCYGVYKNFSTSFCFHN